MTKQDDARYVVATDVGGTCTDAVLFAAGEPVRLGKALSTPPDFADGVLAAVGAAADGIDLTTDAVLAQTALFMHGSTVVDNTLVTRTGARTGLITTEGFEDTLTITRGAYGRWAGLTEDGIKHPVATDRAPPLVPGSRTRGVPERVDYKGAVFARAGRRGGAPGGSIAGGRRRGRGRLRSPSSGPSTTIATNGASAT